MNNAQQKYVRQRLENLKGRKIDEIRNKYADTTLSVKDQVQLLREGKFKILDEPKNPRYYNANLEMFIEFEGGVDNTKIRQEKSSEVTKEFERLLDQLMIGEEVGLLDAIRDFEIKEF